MRRNITIVLWNAAILTFFWFGMSDPVALKVSRWIVYWHIFMAVIIAFFSTAIIKHAKSEGQLCENKRTTPFRWTVSLVGDVLGFAILAYSGQWILNVLWVISAFALYSFVEQLNKAIDEARP